MFPPLSPRVLLTPPTAASALRANGSINGGPGSPITLPRSPPSRPLAQLQPSPNKPSSAWLDDQERAAFPAVPVSTAQPARGPSYSAGAKPTAASSGRVGSGGGIVTGAGAGTATRPGGGNAAAAVSAAWGGRAFSPADVHATRNPLQVLKLPMAGAPAVMRPPDRAGECLMSDVHYRLRAFVVTGSVLAYA